MALVGERVEGRLEASTSSKSWFFHSTKNRFRLSLGWKSCSFSFCATHHLIRMTADVSTAPNHRCNQSASANIWKESASISTVNVSKYRTDLLLDSFFLFQLIDFVPAIVWLPASTTLPPPILMRSKKNSNIPGFITKYKRFTTQFILCLDFYIHPNITKTCSTSPKLSHLPYGPFPLRVSPFTSNNCEIRELISFRRIPSHIDKVGRCRCWRRARMTSSARSERLIEAISMECLLSLKYFSTIRKCGLKGQHRQRFCEYVPHPLLRSLHCSPPIVISHQPCSRFPV